jgi:hypothetical protein
LLGGAPQLRLGVSRQLGVVVGVAGPNRELVRGRVESLGCIFAERLEHSEPPVVFDDQALVHERRNGVERRLADRFGGVERPAACEDGELREQRFLVVLEQVIAPLVGDVLEHRRPARVGSAPGD